MILTCQQLYEQTENPKINQISLELLQEYYKTYLSPYTFKFKVINDNEERIINLRFEEENFCHLLSIEKIMRFTVSNKDLVNYKGQLGWDNIKNGIITMSDLRQKENKKKFQDNKSKFVFFYLIPQLIHSPKGVLFDNEKVAGSSIECEILFYNLMQNAIVHIGLEYSEKFSSYVPRTFLIERITNNNNGDKYISNQQPIEVEIIKKK